MQNGKKTYILNIDDPLRLDINSYWVGQDFALSVFGEPTLLKAHYSSPAVTETVDSFYQKRQTIKVIKQAAFDTRQEATTTQGPQEAPTISSRNSVLQMDGEFTPPQSKRATQAAQTSVETPQTFQQYVLANFVSYFDMHNSDNTSTNDIVYNTETPIVVKDFSTTTNPGLGANEVKEEFLINFLEKRYEDATSIPSVSELSLPNFYEVITTNGPPQESFLDDYVNNIPAPNSTYENIIISMDNYQDLERLNGYGQIFPLEVKLSPNNAVVSGQSSFYGALINSSLDSTLMDLASRSDFTTGAPILEDKFFHMEEVVVSGSTPATRASTVNLKTIDLLEWSREISTIIEGLTQEFATQNKVYLGSETLSVDIAKGNSSALQQILSSAIFLGKIKDITKDNLRSFREINEGQKSYSETVFYKIEKYTSFDAPTPIQNIWIPNIDQADPIEYVDTQVKYDKQYFYRVFAYNAVVGTKYYYDTSTFQSSFASPTLFEAPIASNDKIDEFGLTGAPKPSLSAPGETALSAPSSFGAITPDIKPELGTNVGFDPTGQKRSKAERSAFSVPAVPAGPETGAPPAPVDVGSLGINADYFQIDVVTKPTVDLIKSHLFDFNGSVLDDPPMTPDVNFMPYMGVDNKIIINMNSQIGEYTNKPVILNSEDSEFIDSLRSSRGLPSDSPIRYRTDDETSAFEIYRTQERPASYEDFSNNLRDVVSTLQKSAFDTIYSWNHSYEDIIAPNEEYYYMIRSVDMHNHKSYPSPVYKIKMVNDSGAIYPLVEVIEMRPIPKPKQNFKEFKKFLQIVPAFPQMQIDYDGSNLITESGKITSKAPPNAENITLGTVVPKLFGTTSGGQTFKIRLISKHTGKKLDLNVTFKVENDL